MGYITETWKYYELWHHNTKIVEDLLSYLYPKFD